jgi:serine protease Do
VTPESLACALAELAEQLRRSTVEVRTGGSGVGSGVIWTQDGLVVTNAHVARADTATLVFSDGRSIPGRVTARDRRRDLATIAIDSRGGLLPGLTPATIGHPSTLRTGDLVLAFGNPLGISSAIAMGVVHTVEPGRLGRPRWIRADIRLAPGNSGGPLADAHGRVVGVNTMIANGLGIAVPVTTIARFLSDAGFRHDATGWRAA